MSKDIRSFFLPKGKTADKSMDTVGHKKTKKRVILIDSDSDEPKEVSTKKKKTVGSEASNQASSSKDKLKPISVTDLFGNEKVKRSAKSDDGKKTKRRDRDVLKEFEVHSDDEFLATLSQIDQIERIASSVDINHALVIHKSEPNCSKKDVELVNKFENLNSEKQKNRTSEKQEELLNTNIELKSRGSVQKETPNKSINLDESTNSSTDPDEKKRKRALNYMKYLNRGGPKHLGSKEIPRGKAGCLSGLVFVITGVLDSLEKETAVQLIEQYGGKVTSNVSRNTSYLILGEEAGETKLKKAESCGTPIINEDGLFDLIKSRSKDLSPKNHLLETNLKRKERENNVEDNKQQKKIKKGVSLSETKKKVSVPNVSDLVEKIPHKDVLHNFDTKNNCLKSDSIRDSLESKADRGVHITSYNLTEKSTLWVDKYKPTKIKQIIGQQGDRSSLRKLTIWLENWHKNHFGNKKHVKPSPWAKNDDGAYFKAALLSGPPGIGKTTMAHLVSKELGFDVVEFNASDTRSKKLLHLEISELLSSKTLFGYFHPGCRESQPSVKHILVMDEVDGMAGNEDRGGVQELIQLIKNTRIPIICLCNDRNHPKIRSLANYCFDLRVMKPRLEQIRGAMMSVCYKEGLKIPTDALNDIIYGTNFDIRQILHHLSLWSTKEEQFPKNELCAGSVKPKKDMKMGPWDVVKKVFSVEDHKGMTIYDKSDLFFYDYSINPLFVQENYLSVQPAAARGSITKTLQCIASTADSISMGDVVDKCIRNRNSWSLLPVQAMFSSVIPGDLMEGYMRGQINFPAWLGKNSRRGKFDRLLQELHVHTHLSISGSREAVNLEYLPCLRDAILRPLITQGSDGVPNSLNVMQSYNLLREDLDSILELTLWPNQTDPMNAIESKVKAALTRAYNKEGILTPYSVVNVAKKRSTDILNDYEDDGDEEDVGDSDDVNLDAFIKTKKINKNANEASSKAPRSRGRGRNDANSRRSQKGRGKY